MYYQTLETVGYGQGCGNVTLERFPFSRQSYTGSFDSDSVKILRVSHGKYFVQMHVNTLSCLLTKAQYLLSSIDRCLGCSPYSPYYARDERMLCEIVGRPTSILLDTDMSYMQCTGMRLPPRNVQPLRVTGRQPRVGN